MAGSEIRIERDRPAEKGLGGFVVFRTVFVEVPKPALVGLPSIEPFWRFAQHTLLFRLGQCGFDNPGDARCDLVLHDKDVTKVALVPVGPDMSARSRIDQLRRDAHTVAALPYRAFQHVADTELTTDPFYIDCLSPVGKTRIAGDDNMPA